MSDPEFQQIEQLKSKRKISTAFWFVVKFIIACLIVYFLEYGILIVVGYLIYAVENQSGLIFLNSQEASYHIGKLYNKDEVDVSVLKAEIAALKDQLADFELRLIESELKIEDIGE